MYKLANARGSYKHVQKLVSANFAHYIKLCLGEPDENGNLTDAKRAADFMKEISYLKDLVGKKATIGNGILEKQFPWEDVILLRYSDLLAKLEDTRHEFEFDEFGKGLLFALVDINSTGMLDYLTKYGIDPYEPEQRFIVQFMDEGEDFYNIIKEGVTNNSSDELKECLGEELGELEKRFENNGYDASELYAVYGEMYARCILNISCYLEDEFDEEEMNIVLYQKNLPEDDKEFIKDTLRYMFLSPVVKDYDYDLVMKSLGKSDNFDISLKTGLTMLGLNLKKYDDIFLGKDVTYDLAEDEA
ncbi:hypothetical protein [Butyrivibrio sp. AE2015]|uniref:hypothetical protein n=1 Tax=Butyrivibrio sp. AE2015 TaxID=1280663 RepID=UPI0003B7A179|nr:hypothetical protein [Butyrivibrio sp. AE2015]